MRAWNAKGHVSSRFMIPKYNNTKLRRFPGSVTLDLLLPSTGRRIEDEGWCGLGTCSFPSPERAWSCAKQKGFHAALAHLKAAALWCWAYPRIACNFKPLAIRESLYPKRWAQYLLLPSTGRRIKDKGWCRQKASHFLSPEKTTSCTRPKAANGEHFNTAPKIGGANLPVCGLSLSLKLIGVRAARQRRPTGVMSAHVPRSIFLQTFLLSLIPLLN